MKNLSEISDEKLFEKAKQAKRATFAMGGMLIGALVIFIMIYLIDGFNALFIVPFALLPIMFTTYK